MPAHTLYRCPPGACERPGTCNFCDGGLASCIVCNGAESTLLSHCPGFMLSADAQEDILRGRVYDLEVARLRRAAGNLRPHAPLRRRG
jgi:hypothetical protein